MEVAIELERDSDKADVLSWFKHRLSFDQDVISILNEAGYDQDTNKRGRGGSIKVGYTYDRRIATSDERILLDMYDLSGSHEPVSLAELVRVNEDAPLGDSEIAALRRLRVGQKAALGIGGGHVEVKRVR